MLGGRHVGGRSEHAGWSMKSVCALHGHEIGARNERVTCFREGNRKLEKENEREEESELHTDDSIDVEDTGSSSMMSEEWIESADGWEREREEDLLDRARSLH